MGSPRDDLEKFQWDMKRSVQALDEELNRLRQAVSRENDEVQQLIAKALGYPQYKDLPEFADDDDAEESYFIGENVTITMVMELVRVFEEMRSTGIGVMIDAKDKHGHPIHIGDTLRFDGEEWFRVAGATKDHVFTIEPIKSGELSYDGSSGDLSQYCEVILDWRGRRIRE